MAAHGGFPVAWKVPDYWFREGEFNAQRTAKNQPRDLIGLSTGAFA
jgi:hypothetical protein